MGEFNEFRGMPETDDRRDIIKQKLRQYYDGRVVRKDLTKSIKEGANVPVYVLEYLLGQYCNSDDENIINEGVENVKEFFVITMCVRTKHKRLCHFFVNVAVIR